MNPIPQDEFHSALKALPLVSVDWVIVNRLGEVLTGYRQNAPARHTWFTPGGRIRKGEPVLAALARVAIDELGVPETLAKRWTIRAQLIGAYDHTFADSAFDGDTPTHYVNLPHVLVLCGAEEWLLQRSLHSRPLGLRPPTEGYWLQHTAWCWQPTQVPNEGASRAHDYVQPYLRWVAEHVNQSGVFK